jgi:TonB-dependent SusC/RagA subfamily outer membrane receptor
MTRTVALLAARLLLLAPALAAGSGCRTTPSDDRSEDARARQDSARHLLTERERSSASKAIHFSEADRRRFTRVEHMIQARFTGVQVFPQGRGFSIRIRSAGSFGSGEPFVVIDGASRTTADLGGVSPRDVESIEIVKDAAAAIYGVRGANGVIIVTTRRGR